MTDFSLLALAPLFKMMMELMASWGSFNDLIFLMMVFRRGFFWQFFKPMMSGLTDSAKDGDRKSSPSMLKAGIGVFLPFFLEAFSGFVPK